MSNRRPPTTSLQTLGASSTPYKQDMNILHLLCEDLVYYFSAPFSDHSREAFYNVLWNWFSKIDSSALKQVCIFLFLVLLQLTRLSMTAFAFLHFSPNRFQ